jgi:mercuric ion transport protein
MKSRTVFGVVPAVGFSLLPTLACPACLPALASVLSAAGLTFIAQPRYLVWLNLAALIIALVLLVRNERRWISAPLGVAAAGAAAVMLGKFVWTNSWVWWAGLSVFLLGSIWSGCKQKSGNACINCKTQIQEN